MVEARVASFDDGLSKGAVERSAKSSMGFLACAGRSKVEIGVSESGSETGNDWQENGWQKNGFDEGFAVVEQWLSDC